MISIVERPSTLNNIILYENINLETLDLLINSNVLQEKFRNPFVKYSNEKEQLINYKRNIKSKIESVGKVEVQYTRNYDIGRVNPKKSLGLHSIRREIRHTLARDFYQDIDIINAHPNIMEQLCNKANFQCKYLHKYNTERQEIIDEVKNTYKVSKDTAKNLFIRLLYFGTFKVWADDNKLNEDKQVEPTKFITNFSKELNKIGDLIYKKNKHLLSVLEVIENEHDEKIEENEFKQKARIVSYCLQEIECQCLEQIFNYCLENKIISSNAVLCNDGIMIPKDKYTPELLQIFSDIIKKNLGYELTFINKEMNQGYDIEYLKQNQKYEIDLDTFNHSQCAELFYIKNKNKFLYSKHLGWYEYLENNTLEYYGTSTPISLYKDIPICINEYFNELIDIEELKIKDIRKKIFEFKKQGVKSDDNRIIELNNQMKEIEKNQKKMIKVKKDVGSSNFISSSADFLKNKYEIKDIDKKIDGNSNYLAFDNILYDNTINDFRLIKPEDYISKTTKYNCKCKIFRNEDGTIQKIDIIRNNNIRNELNEILNSIFKTQDMKKYVIQTIAKAIFDSNEGEQFYCWEGIGRNGKGLIMDLVSVSLGEYYYACTSDYLTSKKTGANADSTTVNLKGRRIATVSEPEEGLQGESVFNNTNLKKLSGRDEITTRDLFKGNITFNPQFTLFLQCNKMPVIKSLDKGIMERLKVIKFPYTFCENPIREHEKKIDTSLKTKLRENKDYYNEFLLMLIDEMKIIKNNKIIVKPNEIINDTQKYFNENDPLKLWFDEFIIFSNDANTKPIKLSDLKNHYNQRYNNNLTDKKFKEFITIHLMNNNSKIEILRGYTVVKHIIIKEDEQDEELEAKPNDLDL